MNKPYFDSTIIKRIEPTALFIYLTFVLALIRNIDCAKTCFLMTCWVYKSFKVNRNIQLTTVDKTKLSLKIRIRVETNERN